MKEGGRPAVRNSLGSEADHQHPQCSARIEYSGVFYWGVSNRIFLFHFGLGETLRAKNFSPHNFAPVSHSSNSSFQAALPNAHPLSLGTSLFPKVALLGKYWVE